MNDLKFDIYAMVRPKNTRDLEAMLQEALDELRLMNDKLDDLLAAEPCVPEHA